MGKPQRGKARRGAAPQHYRRLDGAGGGEHRNIGSAPTRGGAEVIEVKSDREVEPWRLDSDTEQDDRRAHGLRRPHRPISNNPAAPIPPPMHIVTTP